MFYSSLSYSVSVIQGFSQVCLLEWGIAFKFYLGVCPIAPCFEHVHAGGGGGGVVV